VGNRESANTTGVSGLASDYTINNRNQITARKHHYIPVSGTVDSDAKVVVAGALAGQQGKYWSGEVMLDNTSGPARAAIAVKAAKPGPPEIIDETTAPGLIAEEVETLSYDLDGNLLEDGLWTYKWDAENRLIEMTSTLPTTGGFTRLKLEFAYDYQGRRVEKKVTNLATSSVTTHRRYLYDGWNLVGEFTVSGSTIGAMQRSYTWGLDVAGTLGGAGGVGALVQLSVHDGSTVTDYYPAYDGNGNVTALVRSNGTLAAAYEYGPFGELLRAQVHDSAVADNPFRHATKFTDVETGLIYYGYRYYSPSLGRFINRDPIGEQGGINLYAFVGNDPVNRWDYLGLNDTMIDPDGTILCWEPRSYPNATDGRTGGEWVPCGVVGGGRGNGAFFYIYGGENYILLGGVAVPQTSTSEQKSDGKNDKNKIPDKKNHELSKQDCEQISRSLLRLQSANHEIMDEMSGLRKGFNVATFISATGHLADVGLALTGAVAARAVGKIAARIWQETPEIAEFIMIAHRKTGIYLLGLESGASGNIQRFTDNISLSFGHAGDRLSNTLIESLDISSGALRNEFSANAHQINKLEEKWKEGQCDRFQ
jgi:RHS repeat-associated protein